MSFAALAKVGFMSVSDTRSCGRAGPARHGCTVERSSSSVSEKIGSGDEAVWKKPFSFA
jgi:hypothetical protein